MREGRSDAILSPGCVPRMGSRQHPQANEKACQAHAAPTRRSNIGSRQNATSKKICHDDVSVAQASSRILELYNKSNMESESSYAWWRLLSSLLLMTLGSAGMYEIGRATRLNSSH